MATQQGNEYEKNVAKFLKEKGLVESNFQPAGSMSDRADLEMMWTPPGKKREVPINVELKIEAASGGSLVLKWTRGKWHFEDKAKLRNNPEKLFLAELAESCGALKQINKAWGIPIKHANPGSGDRFEKQLAATLKNAKDRKAKDAIRNAEQQRLPEQNEELNGSVVARYYAKKKTYYINVGTNGFYRLGNADPAGIGENARKKGLPPIPRFDQAAKVKWRARVQDKGGGNFQYTFELSFTLTKSESSPYNIGPCPGKGNVRITKREANLDCFL